jgi:hypothetical protein
VHWRANTTASSDPDEVRFAAGAYNRYMSIRSWFAKRGQQADADAVKRAEEEAVESAQEREMSRGDRWGMAADNRIARRGGEANIRDVDRLSDL